MARPSLNRNDVVLSEGKLAKMPLGDRGFSLSHSLKENVDGHNEVERPECDVHLTVPNLVFGHTFHENGKASSGHSRLLLSTPSSGSYGPKAITYVNALTAFIGQRLTAKFATGTMA